MTSYQVWMIFVCGFVAGAGVMIHIYSYLRDRRARRGDGND